MQAQSRKNDAGISRFAPPAKRKSVAGNTQNVLPQFSLMRQNGISAGTLHWTFVCQSLPKISLEKVGYQKEKPRMSWGFSCYNYGGRGGI